MRARFVGVLGLALGAALLVGGGLDAAASSGAGTPTSPPVRPACGCTRTSTVPPPVTTTVPPPVTTTVPPPVTTTVPPPVTTTVPPPVTTTVPPPTTTTAVAPTDASTSVDAASTSASSSVDAISATLSTSAASTPAASTLADTGPPTDVVLTLAGGLAIGALGLVLLLLGRLDSAVPSLGRARRARHRG